MNHTMISALAVLLLGSGLGPLSAASPVAAADQWRKEHRLIDLHHHISCTTQHLTRAVRIMDAAGIGLAVNLSGGVVTSKEGPSEFERNKKISDDLFPGRFLFYMNLDYADWDQPDFPERAARQVEAGHKMGAAGLKEYKRLGLYLRNKAGALLKIDDPKLDPVWKRCGELNMPVSIHVADPKAFWLPYDNKNERWTELKDHRSWWFGDTNLYPAREELLEALTRVIARHPKTTFVCVHFANNAEDIDTVDRWLDTYPNMMADLAARIPEVGRHAPDKVHRLLVKHQDRIVFGTDFMVYNRLTLGSGGSGPAPTDDDAQVFFEKHWRWLETRDKDFAHMTPIQGDWTISAVGLPEEVLRKIYFDNARRVLARSLPPPRAEAAPLERDFELTGDLSHSAWTSAKPVRLEYQSGSGKALPAVSTEVRALWSDRYLYLGYRCPFRELTVFEPVQLDKERIGLWEKDVVEAFIGSDHKKITAYREFQVAPSGEKLDLGVDLPDRDFPWSSEFHTRVKVDASAKIWSAEMKIPLTAISAEAPRAGTQWRMNLFRCDQAQKAFLAWNPTLTGSFHTPEKFGLLEFGGKPAGN